MRRIFVLLFSTVGALLLASVALAASNVGYRDFSFAASGVGGAATPMMAQSKLWFNDGTWWGGYSNAPLRNITSTVMICLPYLERQRHVRRRA